MEQILKYFPNLNNTQITQLNSLSDLYKDWNSKINVISRKDLDFLYEHHILHSLSIAKYINFKPSTKIIDVGTGGGFPGIPLAILFPQCEFKLIDSIGKKIKVATEIAHCIGLNNVTFAHENIKDEKSKFDFVVSRAVMNAPDLIRLITKNISNKSINAIPNGLICLKGGDLTTELKPLIRWYELTDIKDYFQEPFFETKKILYVPLT